MNVMSKKNALKFGGGGLYGVLMGVCCLKGCKGCEAFLKATLKVTFKAISEIAVDPLGEKRVGRVVPKPVVAPDL